MKVTPLLFTSGAAGFCARLVERRRRCGRWQGSWSRASKAQGELSARMGRLVWLARRWSGAGGAAPRGGQTKSPIPDTGTRPAPSLPARGLIVTERLTERIFATRWREPLATVRSLASEGIARHGRAPSPPMADAPAARRATPRLGQSAPGRASSPAQLNAAFDSRRGTAGARVDRITAAPSPGLAFPAPRAQLAARPAREPMSPAASATRRDAGPPHDSLPAADRPFVPRWPARSVLPAHAALVLRPQAGGPAHPATFDRGTDRAAPAFMPDRPRPMHVGSVPSRWVLATASSPPVETAHPTAGAPQSHDPLAITLLNTRVLPSAASASPAGGLPVRRPSPQSWPEPAAATATPPVRKIRAVTKDNAIELAHLRETVTRQIHETVERRLSERVDVVVARELAPDSAYARRLAERIHSGIYDSLVLERDRLG
jgi:hypothetical protein